MIEVDERDSRQSHLVLSWRPDLDVGDPRVRASLDVYAMLLGGSMGSRLVSEIREELGWAYSVRAEADALRDTPVLYVTAGLDSANAAKAVSRSREIVAELATGGIGVAEIERARSAAAGRRALALENSTLAASSLPRTSMAARSPRLRSWPRSMRSATKRSPRSQRPS